MNSTNAISVLVDTRNEISQVKDYVVSLTNEERGVKLDELEAAIEYLEKLKEAMYELAYSGIVFSRYSVMQGVQRREWSDKSEAIQFLKNKAINNGINPNEIVEPVSPAKAEKIVGKIPDEFITISEGKPRIKREKGE